MTPKMNTGSRWITSCGISVTSFRYTLFLKSLMVLSIRAKISDRGRSSNLHQNKVLFIPSFSHLLYFHLAFTLTIIGRKIRVTLRCGHLFLVTQSACSQSLMSQLFLLPMTTNLPRQRITTQAVHGNLNCCAHGLNVTVQFLISSMLQHSIVLHHPGHIHGSTKSCHTVLNSRITMFSA